MKSKINFITIIIFSFGVLFLLFHHHIFKEELDNSQIGIVVEGNLVETFPKKDDNYWFSKATCNNSSSPSWDGIQWSLKIRNLNMSRTNCTIEFSKNITISLNSTMGYFSDNTNLNQVSISKEHVNQNLETISKPIYENNQYLFKEYNSKEDGSGESLSYESLLKGITDYYAIWKKNFATVHFESGNLLPDYQVDDWINKSDIQIYNGIHETTRIVITSKSEYSSNGFHYILGQYVNGYWENTKILSLKQGTSEFTMDLESGWYYLQSRLNGSQGDIYSNIPYYFTKGKNYAVHFNATLNNLVWEISNMLLYEIIPSKDIILGEKASKPSTSIFKPDYTVGEKWYTDYARTKEFDFNTPITKDITLYAGFRKN